MMTFECNISISMYTFNSVQEVVDFYKIHARRSYFLWMAVNFLLNFRSLARPGVEIPAFLSCTDFIHDRRRTAALEIQGMDRLLAIDYVDKEGFLDQFSSEWQGILEMYERYGYIAKAALFKLYFIDQETAPLTDVDKEIILNKVLHGFQNDSFLLGDKERLYLKQKGVACNQ